MMRRLLGLGLLLSVAATPAYAQFGVLRVVGPQPELAISSTNPLAGIPLAVDARARLLFLLQSVPTKVTVETTCPGQHFSLAVEAINPTAGEAAPAVELVDGMPAVDFITDIPPRELSGDDDEDDEDHRAGGRDDVRVSGAGAAPIDVETGLAQQCMLQYTARATAAQGNSDEAGVDVHTVTYTIVQQ